MDGGFTNYQMKGKPCTEKEYINWLESIGGECPTQPLPVFDEQGRIKYYMSKMVRIKNGKVVVEDK